MKKTAFFLILSYFLTSYALAADNCFLAKEKNQVLKQEGSGCKTQFAPESTFKIPLSLMGYDAGIFKDEAHPEWPFKEEYDLFINVCKGPHNPQTWMRDSCVWYSQVLTQKLGMNKFKDYVAKFDYGNKDVSGDNAKNSGLTDSWLSSSLQISPEEQVIFLQKFINNTLPVSKKSQDMTKNIMFIQELSGGWKLYGKTGSGYLQDKMGKKTDLKHGWFVGWIEKGDCVVVFASHIADDKKQDTFASFRARNEALIKLWYVIDALEK